MRKFLLLNQFLGYTNKKDKTNIDPRYLVAGSQNVMINDAEKISIRNGYELFGVANTALTPIISSYEWKNSGGGEFAFRSYGTVLEYYYDSAWRTLVSGLTSGVTINFAEWWDSTEVLDLLLFVTGGPNVYAWSGATTTFASATANTITKEGASTWAGSRFLTAGTRQVTIGGTVYTYTGGESTTTLTGVTPDPTSGGHNAGDLVIQTVRTNADVVSVTFNISLIATLNNQVYYGDLTKRDIYLSKNTDYTDVAFSANRLPGEGGILTLDSNPVGFGVQEDTMYISSVKDEWYKATFALSADLTAEALAINRVKSGGRQGARAQSSIGNIKNELIFFATDRTVSTVGQVENINTPQSLPISDSIKLDLLSYDLTIPPHVFFFQSRTYISIPSESLVLIFDHEKKFWQAPQIMAIRRFGVYDGALIGHSASVPETYTLFTGTSDNGNPIDARALLAYRNYGHRAWQKSFDEWFTEGYLSSNTVLNLTIWYDYDGSRGIIDHDIRGDSDDLIFASSTDISLGKNPLGQQPLGTTSDDIAVLSKFRAKTEGIKQDFYEVQIQYSSNEIDAQWELLSTGGNVTTTTADDTLIKQ